MKKAEKRKKPNLLGTILLGILTTVVATAFIGFSYYVANAYSEPRVIEIPVKKTEDSRPSYEYLKSITVQVRGQAEVSIMDELSDLIEEFEKFFENLIYDKDTRTAEWTGTGVILKVDRDYTYILTNNHVAGGGQEDPTIFIKKGEKYEEVEVIQRHSTLDMALLKLKGRLKGKRAVKGVTVAEPQDRVYIAGHHLGRPYIYGEGVFAGYDGVSSLMQLPCLYGNSGSGVVNQDGELIALVYAINVYGWGEVDITHALSVDGTSIRLFLQKNGII